MKPLVSGPEAKRYVDPKTDTYLLFPYQRVEDGIKLITPKLMSTHFPKAWAYLKTYEPVLRAREAKRDQQNEIAAAPFDDHEWYRFGRHQNLVANADIAPVVSQIIKLESELSRTEDDIEKQEHEMNEALYRLYGLTEREIALVERNYRNWGVRSVV